MHKLLVSMGVKPSGRPQDPLCPLLVELDLRDGSVQRTMSWRAPPERLSAPDAHQEFTSASWAAPDLLLQPTHTELLRIDTARWTIAGVTSHRLFHGVHSATASPAGGVVLSCAGTESVLELDPSGRLEAHHWLRAGAFDEAYPQADLRHVGYDELKPHSHHPNHAVWVEGELWATCFETREALTLTGPDRRIPLPEGVPHDGRLRQGLLWFTQVHGHVVAVHPKTLRREVEIDLRAITGTRRMLGWCRGVEVVGDRLFVGMTQLRGTTHREVARWLLKGEAGRKLPTRVLEIDLSSMSLRRELPLGNSAGGTIYAINAC